MKSPPEEIDWNDYSPFQPGADRPWHELSRAEARQVFSRVMDARDERIEALRTLLAANGIVLGDSDDAVEKVEMWFREHVEADLNDPARPRPLWLAVAFDIGVFLGELILERRPTLRWELFVWGERDSAYQRPVIMGFDVVNKRYNIDPVMAVSSDAIAVVRGEEFPPMFLGRLHAANAGESTDPKDAHRRTRQTGGAK